jgi:hypothetical protein
MHAVSSSWVAAIGYDDDAHSVRVELLDGREYSYEQVPHVIWRAFLAAESKGRFVNAVLKPFFLCHPG